MELLIITIPIMLILLIMVYVMIAISKPQPRQNVPRETRQNNVSPPRQKSEDIIDTLDWMLSNGIIDSQEYTKLMGKSLPFM